MRDMVACFSEHAIRVSETTCSSTHFQNPPKSPLISPNPNPALQNAVVSVYKIPKKQILVKFTWSRTQLSITFNEDASTTIKLNTASILFPKKKGARSINHNSSKIEILWDLSEAVFNSNVEPIQGYYIIITVDSELGLILGDLSSKKTLRTLNSTPKFSLACRKEHYSGSGFYSTKARFSEGGRLHEISVQSCSNVLSVIVDDKIVMRVKRLQWNFRGNQTIFLDGLLVDLMWDVYGWLFSHGNGLAVFMFRRRAGVDTRLWLQDKSSVHKEIHDKSSSDFSLMIYASRTPLKEVNRLMLN